MDEARLSVWLGVVVDSEDGTIVVLGEGRGDSDTVMRSVLLRVEDFVASPVAVKILNVMVPREIGIHRMFPTAAYSTVMTPQTVDERSQCHSIIPKLWNVEASGTLLIDELTPVPATVVTFMFESSMRRSRQFPLSPT